MCWIRSEKRVVAGEMFLRYAAMAVSTNLIIDTFRSETPVFQNGLQRGANSFLVVFCA